jgi:hypothetical protein
VVSTLMEAAGFGCVVVAVDLLASPVWALLTFGVGLLVAAQGVRS